MVRATGNAPAYSCSRSKRLTFRLRPERIPSAPNPAPGMVAVRQHLRPCEASAIRPDSLGKWTGMRVARPLLRFGRPACVSQHLCPKKWNPVRESHSLGWFCRPLPELFGQRDVKLKCGRELSPPPALFLEPVQHYDRTKSAITAGTDVSKPTTSSMPRSFGSAWVKPLLRRRP